MFPTVKSFGGGPAMGRYRMFVVVKAEPLPLKVAVKYTSESCLAESGAVCDTVGFCANRFADTQTVITSRKKIFIISLSSNLNPGVAQVVGLSVLSIRPFFLLLLPQQPPL